MRPPWLAYTMVLGVLISAMSAASSADLRKREIFTFVPGISDNHYAILTKAYTDAIFIAHNALNPPTSVNSGIRNWIFQKYFPTSAEDTVSTIYKAIVGDDFRADDIHVGNATFSHLLVDVHDSNGYCAADPNKNYVNRNGTVITICPNFWTVVGDHPEKQCSDLPEDNIVSWQMTFPGDMIFNLLIGFVGEKAINGQDIVNWQIDDKRDHTGAANAMYIKYHTEDTAVLSAMNYNWYALELYWTAKCGRTYRGPVNQYENYSGVCKGEHCGTGPQQGQK